MPCRFNDLIQCLGAISYRYFFRYFFVSEVGERWAMFNNLIGFFGLCVGIIYVAKPWGLRNWNRNVVNNKRRLRELAFKKLDDDFSTADENLSEKRRRISSLSFFELKDKLQNGELTAMDAVDAFRWKALECQKKYNCVVEFVKEAIDYARDLDTEYADKNKPKPPLFGLPFSVKESFMLVGYDCSRGLAKELEWPMKEECTLVSHLRSLGAIPIVRTCVPQTLLSYMCSSPVYGTTLNPHDSTRTCGGSTGGEACLVAAGGCAFGIGSDVGGSLRIPAHFCGITSLKATAGRLKVENVHPGIPGVSRLGLGYGFFTQDVESQTFLFRHMLVPEYFVRIPGNIPLPFTDFETSDRRPLRIGFYVEDGWFNTVPACKTAVSKAIDILKTAGHELVPFVIPNPEHAMGLLPKLLFADNGAYWLRSLQYEDIDQYLKNTYRIVATSTTIRWLASKIISIFDPKFGGLVGAYVKNLADLRTVYEEADEYVKNFVRYWQSLNLDAMVGTAFPFPAVQHEYPTKLNHAAFATWVYNMLDFPAGVVRVHQVTKNDEEDAKNYPTSEAASKVIPHPVDWMVRKAMVGTQDLPVGVQVVALPWKEEMCLKVMQIIQDGVKKG